MKRHQTNPDAPVPMTRKEIGDTVRKVREAAKKCPALRGIVYGRPKGAG
jgi:hypothetical protein